MKRSILFLALLFLVACGGAKPILTPVVPSATAIAASLPATPSPTPTATCTRPTSEPTLQASRSSESLTLPSESRTLPAVANATTLGSPVPACVGEGLSVADGGVIYTLGRRDDQPCASAIDLATGAVEPIDPASAFWLSENSLRVHDPARGSDYVVEGGAVIAYDAGGQQIGPVLRVPLGDPEGFTTADSLHLDQAADRLYLRYQDFDGQGWIALADLGTGKHIVDVPVPAGPWALTPDGRLVFADATTLVVLDGATLETTGRLSLSRQPADAVMDPDGRRLFVTDAGGDLYVLDPTTLVNRDYLPGLGSAVDLDPRLGQLYVGDRYSGGVHVLDLSTLEPLGRIPQPGQPVASPADGQVYIVEEDIYQAYGATLELVRGRTIRNSGCNGCIYPTDAIVDPTTGLVYTTTYGVWSGKPGPASQAAVDPLTGRMFVARTTGGYQATNSLAAYTDLSQEKPTRWLDGLYGQPMYNPYSTQLYLAYGERLCILNSQTLEFLGGVEVGEGLTLLAVDMGTGRFYGAQGDTLLQFEATGGPPRTPGPEPVAGLPGPVYGIAISPDFAQDATLLTRATDWETGRAALYRSRDRGQSWERLSGGLPGPPNALTFGPDGRLYAALAGVEWGTLPEAAIWGEGVYVSDDGGDTWRPDSAGLTHLRVGQLHAAQDGTLYALTTSTVEPGGAASGPTLWSRPPSQAWQPLIVPDTGPLRLVDYAVPTTYILTIRAHWHNLTRGGPLYQSWGNELQRSDDGGQSWQTIGLGPAGYADRVIDGREGVYWVGAYALWRSTDEGTTWGALRHPDLDGPPFVTVVADVDGAETLFLGTEMGQVIIVLVAEAEWEPR